MLIATDLDGTFLAGSPAQKEKLYRFITQDSHTQLAYVTGRGLPLVLPLLEEPDLARPDYIICDVGATLTDRTGALLHPLMREVTDRWPGEDAIVQALADIPGLQRQEQPQARRVSFYCSADAVTTTVAERVQALGCDLLYSADLYLDVLPPGVNKGSSLRRLVQHLGLDPEHVLVAGDTLNDLSMFTHGFKGVCVGESEPALLQATAGLGHVFHASAPGCDGILQALQHFDMRYPAA
jgi:HAD superfamily hydrolase (TIGR01484 family)